MLPARGQRDVEARRSLLRVVEEQFEEVAHSVKQQAVGSLGLECEILRHHRRRSRFALQPGCHRLSLELSRSAGNRLC
jgi:hypothetical protein